MLLKTARYGWRPDIPDVRDLHYVPSLVALPPLVDLRSKCPPIYDQGNLGSCTANSLAGVMQFLRMKESTKDETTPSRLMLYYDEREIEGTTDTDAGAQIRDGVKTINQTGVCDESIWPYDESKFTIKPPASAYAAASKDRVLKYERIDNTQINALRSCLADGYIFPFGFTVYQSFESQEVAQSGVVPMPTPDEGTVGGHAVAAVGYDDKENYFIVRNSWSPSWGIDGCFLMPYAYLGNDNLADDAWKITVVSPDQLRRVA